jgi:hypothetical protein
MYKRRFVHNLRIFNVNLAYQKNQKFYCDKIFTILRLGFCLFTIPIFFCLHDLGNASGPSNREHRSSVVAREMSRKEVMLAVAVVAVASLVQAQQQHQLMNCQQRCGQFYLESQQVKHSFALFLSDICGGEGPRLRYQLFRIRKC